MKTLSKLFLFIFSIALLSSCKKYEEGPLLSLRSKEARLANSWKVEKYLENGVDKTSNSQSFFDSYSEEFTKDGIYSYSYVIGNDTYTGSGKWEFQSDETEIKVSGVSGASSETLVILKLKNDEFWYYIMDGSDKQEYHLIPKE